MAFTDVSQARQYLIQTATPGASMAHQGTALAIGRLNPAYAVRLANAIQTARAQGINASVFSSFRTPSWNKSAGLKGPAAAFDAAGKSLHSYGLATDIAGIGAAGGATAKAWYEIATAAGIYNPYGYKDPKEFNHYQGVPQADAPLGLRGTINPDGTPKDLGKMWAAAGLALPSGVTDSGGPAATATPFAMTDVGSNAQGRDLALGVGKGRISSGPVVGLWQEYLKAHGFDPGSTDGKFGPRTIAATQQFQTSIGVTPDGVVGNQTRLAGAPTIPPTSGPGASLSPNPIAVARAGIPAATSFPPPSLSPSQAPAAPVVGRSFAGPRSRNEAISPAMSSTALLRPGQSLNPMQSASGQAFNVPGRAAIPPTTSLTSVKSPTAVDWYETTRPTYSLNPPPAPPSNAGLPMQQGFNQRSSSPMPAATGPGGAPLQPPTPLRSLFSSIPGYDAVARPQVAQTAGNSTVPFGGPATPAAKPVGQPTTRRPDFEGDSYPTSAPSDLSSLIAARATAAAPPSNYALPMQQNMQRRSTASPPVASNYYPDFAGQSWPTSVPSNLAKVMNSYSPPTANGLTPPPMGTVTIPKGMSSLQGPPSNYAPPSQQYASNAAQPPSAPLSWLPSRPAPAPAPSWVSRPAAATARPAVVPTVGATPPSSTGSWLGGLPAGQNDPFNVTPAGGPSPMQVGFAGIPDIGAPTAPVPVAPQHPILTALRKNAIPFAASAIAGPVGGALAKLLMSQIGKGSAMGSNGSTGIYAPSASIPFGATRNTNYAAQAYNSQYGGSSPYVPAGYTAPTFDPVNGGSTYAYHSNGNGTGTYMTGNGTVFSYN